MADIKVPAVGESVTEGVLVEWSRQDGDWVDRDDPLFELETDKVTMTVNAEEAGKLAISVEPGATVEVGQVVGKIDTSAQRPAGDDRQTAGAVARDGKEADETSQPAAQVDGRSQAASAPTQKVGAGARKTGSLGPGIPGGQQSAAAQALSPSVRRMLREHSVDADDVHGTGKGGRITREDVERAVNRRGEGDGDGEAAPAVRSRSESDGPRQVRKPMTPLRKRIAQRLLDAKQSTAMLTTFNEADMTNVMELRKRYNDKDAFQKKHGVKLGFMGFFVKAVVDALQTVPAVNAFIEGDEIVENRYYDIGVAVGTEKGLVVPVIRDAERLSFAEVEKTIGDLAKRARDRKLTFDDLTGGVFTVSNGGVYGSLLSTPILNPPQSAILGMHAIKKRAMVMPDNSIQARPMMYLAVSYDHRLIDGAEAVTFLKRIVDCIENPERMLLGI